MSTIERKMEEQTNKNIEKTGEAEATNPVAEWLSDLYKKFNLFSEIKKTDHVTVMIGKIFIRIIGFVVLLILSPFLFIGLMLAFAFAG